MREIVLDTETTGLDPNKGDRLVEIGAIEIMDLIPTGRTFHVLINPEREVPEEAVSIHGHTTAILKDKPVFAAVAADFLAFIGNDRLIIHNAEFDMRFVNAELALLGKPAISNGRVLDTLALARKKHPGASNSLDALCDRYKIDRTRRIRHGALLDSEILVDIYIELSGGRQKSLALSATSNAKPKAQLFERIFYKRPVPLPIRLKETEISAHEMAVARLGNAAFWRKYQASRRDDANC